MMRAALLKVLATGAFVVVVGAFPLAAYAASTAALQAGFSIVPPQCNCENQYSPSGGTMTTAPSYGCVIATVENVVTAAIGIGIIAATIAMVWAGAIWMTAAGNPEAKSKGRSMLINVFIGLMLVLSAWLIVDYLMKKLYKGDNGSADFQPWNNVLAGSSDDMCIVATQPRQIDGLVGGLLTNTIGGNTGAGGIGGQVSGTPGDGQVLNGGPGSTNLNVSAADAYLRAHTSGSPQGACWTHVREALCAGGMSSFCSSGGYNAYAAGPHLTAAGFSAVYQGSYSYPGTQNGFAYQAGDIVIFSPVPGHSNGHAAMYDGHQWVSDYVQPRMDPNIRDYPGGHFVVYRPH